MKQRIISAIIALLIVIPFFFAGGYLFKISICLLSIFTLKELLDIKETKKQIPLMVKILSYIIIVLLLFVDLSSYRLLASFFLIFLIPIIIYQNKKYNIEDAFFLISAILLLSVFLNNLIILRDKDIYILIYLVLIAIITDTFSYITGILFGKHKLIESLSPKKTWEGSIGGTFFCIIFATLFYVHFIKGNIYLVILMTLLLSILGQFGDLFFSSIKRYYNKKDFSNIMPGHGGLLDRLDSLIFVLLGYMLFL